MIRICVRRRFHDVSWLATTKVKRKETTAAALEAAKLKNKIREKREIRNLIRGEIPVKQNRKISNIDQTLLKYKILDNNKYIRTQINSNNVHVYYIQYITYILLIIIYITYII